MVLVIVGDFLNVGECLVLVTIVWAKCFNFNQHALNLAQVLVVFQPVVVGSLSCFIAWESHCYFLIYQEKKEEAKPSEEESKPAEAETKTEQQSEDTEKPAEGKSYGAAPCHLFVSLRMGTN